MSQVCVLLLVLFEFARSVFGYPGETVMLMPPLEVRTVDSYPISSQFSRSRNPNGLQQQLLHKVDPNSHTSSSINRNHEPSLSDFINGLNSLQTHETGRESSQYRAANVGRNSINSNDSYRAYSGPYPLPSSPGYGAPHDYHPQSHTPLAPEPLLPKDASIKPDFSLFKPVSTKMTSKVGGLLSLILGMFSGSKTDGLPMNGLTELIVSGIVKPLLVAKGGLKTLMSKLTIPLIALLLINLEVLVTVWWLWEDCDTQIEPKPIPPPVPTYSYKKPSYDYNTYSSYP